MTAPERRSNSSVSQVWEDIPWQDLNSSGSRQWREAGSPSFAGGTLQCKCTSNPVEVSITAQCAHNHVCGCTKCWKPAGALFSQVAVVPRDKLRVTKNADKLKVVDANAAIQRHACRVRRAHVRPHREHQASVLWLRFHPHRAFEGARLGSRPNSPRLFPRSSSSAPLPTRCRAVRARLKELQLEPYDCLSPALMDAIATHVAKASGVLRA